MYTCLAVDDEFSALEILTDHIAIHSELQLLKTYLNPLLALKEIEKLSKPIDIIFLDIQMPGINGIELAGLIKHKVKKIVFTTAHSSYALNSYEIEADGFLLKPLSAAMFARTIQRLFPNPDNPVIHQSEDFMMVKSKMQRNQLIRIKLAHIIAIEAQERSTRIFTTQGVVMSNSSLSEVSELLMLKAGFSRIHRSFIIADNQVKNLERSHIILSTDLKVPIGRKYSSIYDKMALIRK